MAEENTAAELNQIGQIIGYERGLAGISVGQLCSGICSRSYLARIESGERGCEKIVSEALLQRLGVSSSRFLYFLNPKEHRWLLVRERLVQAVNERQAADFQNYRAEYEKLTKGKSRLHRQFLLLADVMWEWKGLWSRKTGEYEETENSEGIIAAKLTAMTEKLREAWKVTQDAYPLEGTCPERMCFTELFLKSLFVRIREESGQKQEALEGYRALLRYLEEKVDERERVVLYPQIGYRTLLLLEKSGTDERTEAARIYQNCIAILKHQGGLYQLPELMEYRIRQLKKAGQEGKAFPDLQKEIEEAEALRSSLQWLYRIYSVEPPEWIWYLSDETEEVHLLSDMVRGRRLAMGLTQKELAEGICDPVTISRIENGSVVPKQNMLAKLLEKLRVPGGDAVISAQVGKPELYRMVGDIRNLTMFSKNEEAMFLLQRLKEQVKRNRYVDQYLLYEEALLAYGMKIIEAPIQQERLWEALHLTVPKAELEALKTWVFSRTEAMIINGISYGCEKVGERKKGISWLRLLQHYYERQPFTKKHYLAGYELTLRNLGNLLGNQQEYTEAIRLEDIAIRLGLEAGQGDGIRVVLYDRGWNMEQLWAQGDYTKEQSRPYMKAALALARMFAKPSSLQHVEKHWEKFYGDPSMAEVT